MLKNILWLAIALAPAFAWGLRAGDYARRVQKMRNARWQPGKMAMFMFTALVFYAWSATVFCARLFPEVTGEGDRVALALLAFEVACIAAMAGLGARPVWQKFRYGYDKLDEFLYRRLP